MTGNDLILLAGKLAANPALGDAEALWDSGQADAQDVADRLDDLRRDRNRADYDLDSPRFRKQVNAVRCVELADEVRAAIDRCRQEPALSEIRSRLSGS